MLKKSKISISSGFIHGQLSPIFAIFFEERFLARAIGFHSFRAVLGPCLATVRQWSPHNVAVFAHDHFLGTFEQAVVMLQGNAVSFVAVVIFDCFTPWVTAAVSPVLTDITCISVQALDATQYFRIRTCCKSSRNKRNAMNSGLFMLYLDF